MSKKEKRPFFMSVINLGTPEFPRFCIADQKLRYWTGEKWTMPQQEKSALVYATEKDAIDDMQKLMTKDYSHLKKKLFMAPVYIEVFSDKDIPMRDLKWWLFRTTKVIVDSPRHGNGPAEGSLGIVRIEYSEMKEVTG